MYFMEHNGLAGPWLTETIANHCVVRVRANQKLHGSQCPIDRCEKLQELKFQEMRCLTAPVSVRKEPPNTFVKKLPKQQGLLQKTWPSGSVVFLNIVHYRDSITFRRVGLLFCFKWHKDIVQMRLFVLWKRYLTWLGFFSLLCTWRQ